MKKIILFLLVLTMLTGLVSAFAIDKGEARAVIGANLNEEQRAQVYETFGIEQGSVTELLVTNDEERAYLEGLVDPAYIGVRSISSAYIEILGEGEGLQVGVYNINWCTKEMYVNALVTAGITDAKLIVTSPLSGITGTAALTGIYKAYEDISGEKLSQEAKLAGTQELVITSDLADQIGSYDAVTIVNELKLVLSETVNMTYDEVKAEIERIASEYNIKLSDGQKNQLIKLCRSLEGLNPEQLKERVEKAQKMIENIAKASSTVKNIVESVKDFFEAVGNFLADLFGGKK